MKILRKNSKSVAFKVDIENCSDQVECDVDDNLTMSISLLTKRFIKVMIRLDMRSKNNVYIHVKYN